MASRLYYPRLVILLLTVCKYIARYRPQIEKALQANFGAGAVTALDAVMVACEAFTSIVELEENP